MLHPREYGVIPTSTAPLYNLLIWLRARNWGSWLRPGTVTAVFAAILISTLLYIGLRRSPVTTPSAAELLSRASVAEETVAAPSDTVLHRTIMLEERRTDAGDLITRRRIEVWQNSGQGAIARRLYDERGSLVGGDWRRADGTRQTFNHGSKLKTAPIGNDVSLAFSELWQLEPSAKNFSTLIGSTGGAQAARLEERQSAYVISYESREAGSTGGLIRATLTLSRADLRATEQTLTVRQGEETREYRFMETSFERRPASTVAPAVFEPDPELLGVVTKAPAVVAEKEPSAVSASGPLASAPLVASADLEVEVLERLNQVNAFFGEQVSLKRMPEGQLRVEGIVETQTRKEEILQALAPVRNTLALVVDVETVAEAAKRQLPQRQQGTVTSTSVEVDIKSAIPADAELRAYFKQKGLSGEQLETEIKRFADRVIAHSRKAVRQALALKQIAERFSAEDLRTLDDAARAKWQAMISQHARGLAQEMEALRRELQPVFPTASSQNGTGDEISVTSDADVARAAKQLFNLASAIEESVNMSFSIYAGSQQMAAVKTPRFWISLNSEAVLTAKLQRATSTAK